MKNLTIYSLLILVISIHSCSIIEPPKPVFPIPNAHKMEWQKMEFFSFIHFSINTFIDIEWTYGYKFLFLWKYWWKTWDKIIARWILNISANPIQQKVIFLNTIPEKNIKFMSDKIMNVKDKKAHYGNLHYHRINQ